MFFKVPSIPKMHSLWFFSVEMEAFCTSNRANCSLWGFQGHLAQDKTPKAGRACAGPATRGLEGSALLQSSAGRSGDEASAWGLSPPLCPSHCRPPHLGRQRGQRLGGAQLEWGEGPQSCSFLGGRETRLSRVSAGQLLCQGCADLREGNSCNLPVSPVGWISEPHSKWDWNQTHLTVEISPFSTLQCPPRWQLAGTCG